MLIAFFLTQEFGRQVCMSRKTFMATFQNKDVINSIFAPNRFQVRTTTTLDQTSYNSSSNTSTNSNNNSSNNNNGTTFESGSDGGGDISTPCSSGYSLRLPGF